MTLVTAPGNALSPPEPEGVSCTRADGARGAPGCLAGSWETQRVVRPQTPRVAGAARGQPRRQARPGPPPCRPPALLPWQPPRAKAPPSAPSGLREREVSNGCRACRSASFIGCPAGGTAHPPTLATSQRPCSSGPPGVGKAEEAFLNNNSRSPALRRPLPALQLAPGSILPSHWRAVAPARASIAGTANERRRR